MIPQFPAAPLWGSWQGRFHSGLLYGKAVTLKPGVRLPEAADLAEDVSSKAAVATWRNMLLGAVSRYGDLLDSVPPALRNETMRLAAAKQHSQVLH